MYSILALSGLRENDLIGQGKPNHRSLAKLTTRKPKIGYLEIRKNPLKAKALSKSHNVMNKTILIFVQVFWCDKCKKGRLKTRNEKKPLKKKLKTHAKNPQKSKNKLNVP